MKIKFKTPQSSERAPFVKRVILFSSTIFACMFGLAPFVQGPIQKDAYMGTLYCASCHQEEFKSWLKSPHAKATDVLPLESRTNPACLSCHATALFQPSEPFFKGVQCEACHGAGKYYSSLHIKKDPSLSKLMFMQKPDLESCRHCHFGDANLWSSPHVIQKTEHGSLAGRHSFHGTYLKVK